MTAARALRRLPAQVDRVLIAANPGAGAGSRWPLVEQLSERLTSAGLQVEVVTDLDRVTEQALKLHEQGTLRALVCGGGDGTASELANRTGCQVPLATLPLGTENLLARYLGFSDRVGSVAQTVTEGLVARLDVGRAGERIFLLMASCGFDSDVVRRMHAMRRGNISRLSYGKPIWDALRSYEYPPLKIRFCCHPAGAAPPDAWEELEAAWAFVFNFPCYGGNLALAPQATATDGTLELCTFRHGSLARGLWYLMHVWMGRHGSLADQKTVCVSKVQIESDVAVPVQLDGDPGGWLPLDIEVLPGRLQLLVPDQWARGQGLDVSEIDESDPDDLTCSQS